MVGKKEKYLVAAQKFIERGQLDKALAELTKVVQDDPKDTRTWLRMAELHARRSAIPEAVDIYLRTAELYVEQGFAQKAIAVYKNVLKLAPGTIPAHLKLGGLFNQMGLISDGVQQMELAAAAQQRAGNLAEAANSLRRALEMQPDNVVLRVKVAEAASQAGMQEEAIREFALAADQLKAQGRADEHLRVLERLLFHDTNNLPRAYELAETYLARGNPRLALPKLQACINAAPQDPRGLALLAKALEQLAQIPKAVSVLKELAALCDELGRLSERDAAILRALTLDANDPELQAAAERYHVRRGDVSGYEPTPPPLGTGLGAAEVGSNSSSSSSSSSIFSGPPSRLDSFDGGASGVSGAGAGSSPGEYSGRVLAPTGTVETARLSNSGPAPSAEADIGRILAESEVYVKYGILDRAAEHLRRALAIDPGHRGAREKLIDTLVALGRSTEAARELEQLGSDLARADHGRARRAWERALTLDPGAQRAREGLASLERPARDVSLAAGEHGDPEPHEQDHARGGEATDVGDELSGFPVPGRTADVPISWDMPVSGPQGSDVGAAGGVIVEDIAEDIVDDISEDISEDISDGISDDMDIADVSAGLSVDRRARGAVVASAEPVPLIESGAHDVSASDVVDESDDPALDVVTPPPETNTRATVDIEVASIVSEAAAGASLLDTPAPAPEPEAAVEGRGQIAEEARATAEVRLPAALLELEARATPSPEPLGDVRMRQHTDPLGYEIALDPSRRAFVEPPGLENEPSGAAVAREQLEHEAVPIGAPPAVLPDQPSSVHVPEPMPPLDTDRERHEPADAHLDDERDDASSDAHGADPVSGFQAERRADADAVDEELADVPGDGFGSSAPTRAAPDWYDGAMTSPATVAGRADAAPWPPDDAELSAELDQADFFLEQDMPEEALALLKELEERWPGHPLLEAKRLEADGALARHHAGDPARSAVSQPVPQPVLAAPATHIEPIGVPREVTPAPVAIVADGAPADYTTHADLGIAYKEMGLLDAAINEFKVVTQDPAREVFALTMMGECYEAKGAISEAVIRYKRALNCEQVTEAENIALYFLLGAAFERLGDVGEALYFYEKVLKRDPSFRGVDQKVAALKPRLARRA